MKTKILPLFRLVALIALIWGCQKENATENQTIPIVTTKPVTNITQTTAATGGNITANGGAEITSKGICWSTNTTPTIDANKTTDGIGSENFVSTVTGLNANTTYYVRAYAINKLGVGYGNIISFVTLANELVITDFDGNTYKTIKIGNQIWMAENLKSTHYSDGTTIQSYCYNNDTSNIKTYGRLYSSFAVMKGAASSNSNPSNVQGIAPIGWHVPSKAEWEQLANYLGGVNVAGGKMKETGTNHWVSSNIGATNESGFTALPAGMHDFTGIFQWFETNCAFYSSTANPAEYSFTAVMLKSETAKLTVGDFHPNDALSVRCIKN